MFNDLPVAIVMGLLKSTLLLDEFFALIVLARRFDVSTDGKLL